MSDSKTEGLTAVEQAYISSAKGLLLELRENEKAGSLEDWIYTFSYPSESNIVNKASCIHRLIRSRSGIPSDSFQEVTTKVQILVGQIAGEIVGLLNKHPDLSTGPGSGSPSGKSELEEKSPSSQTTTTQSEDSRQAMLSLYKEELAKLKVGVLCKNLLPSEVYQNKDATALLAYIKTEIDKKPPALLPKGYSTQTSRVDPNDLRDSINSVFEHIRKLETVMGPLNELMNWYKNNHAQLYEPLNEKLLRLINTFLEMYTNTPDDKWFKQAVSRTTGLLKRIQTKASDQKLNDGLNNDGLNKDLNAAIKAYQTEIIEKALGHPSPLMRALGYSALAFSMTLAVLALFMIPILAPGISTSLTLISWKLFTAFILTSSTLGTTSYFTLRETGPAKDLREFVNEARAAYDWVNTDPPNL